MDVLDYKNHVDASHSSDSVEDKLLSHIFKKQKTENNNELKSRTYRIL